MDEDIRRGHFGLAPEGEPLSAEEVEHLPEAARIVVIWSGGNGPHEYMVAIDDRGVRYAESPDGAPNDRMRFYNELTFVGDERYHTRVWRIDR